MTVKEIQEVLERIQSVSMKDTRTVPATAPMSVQDLAEAFDLWESDGFHFTHLGMNAEDYRYLKRGAMAYLWGAVFIMTTSLTPGDVRVITQTGGTLKVFSFKVER